MNLYELIDEIKKGKLSRLPEQYTSWGAVEWYLGCLDSETAEAVRQTSAYRRTAKTPVEAEWPTLSGLEITTIRAILDPGREAPGRVVGSCHLGGDCTHPVGRCEWRDCSPDATDCAWRA